MKRCNDCKNFAPIYDKLVEFFQSNAKDKVFLGKVDCEVHEEISFEYKIKKYPTLAIYHFNNAEIQEKLIEPNNYEMVKTWIINNCRIDIAKSNQENSN